MGLKSGTLGTWFGGRFCWVMDSVLEGFSSLNSGSVWSCGPGRIPGVVWRGGSCCPRWLQGRVYSPAVFNKIAFCFSHLTAFTALGDV